MTDVPIHDIDRDIVAGIGSERSVRWASTSSGSYSGHLDQLAQSAMEKKLISTAKIETAHAGKYLVQLAKHWSHRFPDLTWNETRADIPFPAGQCVFTSKENVLAIALTVPDEETASRLENVVAEHLKRFAFRESLEIVWQRAQ